MTMQSLVITNVVVCAFCAINMACLRYARVIVVCAFRYARVIGAGGPYAAPYGMIRHHISNLAAKRSTFWWVILGNFSKTKMGNIRSGINKTNIALP